MATLYIVATPIGNLEDITYRAIRTLSEVDLILCEDTRITKRLLAKYEINTPLDSYHCHTSEGKHQYIMDVVLGNKNVALVSDAGTPTISDPGVKIIDLVRSNPELEVDIVVIPGASAVTSALSVSGLPSSEFLFLGFIPHKKGRKKLFEEISETKRTVAFYESPHRILKTLNSLEEVLDDTRSVVVARELTKIHEQTIRGSASEIKEYFNNNPDKVRGEFVVMVGA